MFTRLTATVTILAPDASWVRTMAGYEMYLPVQTMRRESNDLSAITNGSLLLNLESRALA